MALDVSTIISLYAFFSIRNYSTFDPFTAKYALEFGYDRFQLQKSAAAGSFVMMDPGMPIYLPQYCWGQCT
jgi:hypothetical protein